MQSEEPDETHDLNGKDRGWISIGPIFWTPQEKDSGRPKTVFLVMPEEDNTKYFIISLICLWRSICI